MKIMECKLGNEIFYRVLNCKGSVPKIKREIYCRTVVREVDGHYTFMLYTSDMEPVHEVFEFLNYYCATRSINTRTQALHALKFLYAFCEIFDKEVFSFTFADVNNLKLFLKGISLRGARLSVEFITQRSNRTINSYFSVYRDYLQCMNIKTEAFFKERYEHTTDMEPSKRRPYAANERIVSKNLEVPMYITTKDFSAMLRIVRVKYGLREEAILRLMYQHGLRLGEVLGLTNDDLLMEKIENHRLPVAYIRNRLSDKPFQMAKTCMKVMDRAQYTMRDYQEYGFQKIILDDDLYELLQKYICEFHESAVENHATQYALHSLADRVRPEEPYETKNRYVFINRNGRVLRADSWNSTLREIYRGSGIIVDTGVRKHNLSHRLRHGFAMYQVQQMNRSALKLMRLMRHSSVKSVEAYFKPTFNDHVRLKREFEESLMKDVPGLNHFHGV